MTILSRRRFDYNQDEGKEEQVKKKMKEEKNKWERGKKNNKTFNWTLYNTIV